MRGRSRAERNIRWVEQYCRYPLGPLRGQRVRLTEHERELLRRIYDAPNGPQQIDLPAPLSAFVALLHIVGPEALQHDFRPDVHPDSFTLWNATSEALREVLRREGEAVTCPELGTRYPAAA